MPSVYNKNRITKKGYNLLAESIATKKPVTFTKVVIGDGDDNGLNIDTMTNVVSEKLTLPVLDGQKDGDGQYLVTAVLSNSTVETGFFPKEVALFAKCGDGEEILYSYSNGGNNVGRIPDKNTPINSEIYNIRTKIGNATNITFVTSDDTYVTKGALTKHNADANAHDNRFKAIIQQVNDMITSVDNSDSLAKAPTLQLVKTLLSSLNIKNATDVVNALESEKSTGLGIRYDFSNVNAWYICLGKLFGNLIIQGGNNLVRGNKESFITLPISYSKFFVPVSNPEYDAIRKFNINMVSMYSGGEGLNKVHLTTDVWGDSDVDKEIYCWWLTVGI